LLNATVALFDARRGFAVEVETATAKKSRGRAGCIMGFVA
jgi:hypothetical protein